MPVAKGPKLDTRNALIAGAAAVVVALVIGFAAISLAQQSNRLVLGDIDFRSLDAQSMSDEIAENGPILWPDIASGSRDVWLQHIGDDIESGWFAFDARQPGEARECNAVWDPTDRDFDSPCTDESYSETGEGLPAIAVFLDGPELIIDINGVRTAEDFSDG